MSKMDRCANYLRYNSDLYHPIIWKPSIGNPNLQERSKGNIQIPVGQDFQKYF